MKGKELEMSLLGVATQEKKTAVAVDKNAKKKRAACQIQQGKQLVIAGFAVSIVGIIIDCAIAFSGGMNQEFGSGPYAWWTLGVIGFGTLLWIVGSLRYLRGAMDTSFDGEPKL